MYRATRLSGAGIIVSLVALASLFLPWWSIRASGVSIDVYPFAVVAWNVPRYNVDWVVNRLLGLDGALLIVGFLVVVSSVMVAVGSLRFRFLLVAPLVLNLAAAFLFFGLMYSAIGELAFGYFSGTSLIASPGGPWGFAVGIGLCVLAGIASPILLALSYLSYFRSEQHKLEGQVSKPLNASSLKH